MNRVILCGRLVKDPDVRYSQGQQSVAVARYTLAVDRQVDKKKANENNQATADFIECVAIGANGTFAEKYLHKGTKILVEGTWQTGNYTNRNGQKVYTNNCLVQRHEFVESKAQSVQNQVGQQRAQQGTSSNLADDGFMTIPDGIDDPGLPFN